MATETENLTVGINQLPGSLAVGKQQKPLKTSKTNKNLAGATVSAVSKPTVDECSPSTATDESACIRSIVKKFILERNVESDDIGSRVKVGGNLVYVRIDQDCWHPLRSMMSKTSTKQQPSKSSKSSNKSPEEPVVIFIGQIHENVSSALCTTKGIPFKVACSVHARVYVCVKIQLGLDIVMLIRFTAVRLQAGLGEHYQPAVCSKYLSTDTHAFCGTVEKC